MGLLSPTHYSRKKAEIDAREIYKISKEKWEKLSHRQKLSLMLDAVIIILSRKIVSGR